MGCVGNCCASASKLKATPQRMAAMIARRLQDIVGPQLDQLLPVDHRGSVGATYMQLCPQVDRKLLRPLAFHEHTILFPNVLRKSDQLVRWLVQCKISSYNHISGAFPFRRRRNEEKINDTVSVGINVFVINGKRKDDIIGEAIERYLARVRSTANL